MKGGFKRPLSRDIEHNMATNNGFMNAITSGMRYRSTPLFDWICVVLTNFEGKKKLSVFNTIKKKHKQAAKNRQSTQ